MPKDALPSLKNSHVRIIATFLCLPDTSLIMETYETWKVELDGEELPSLEDPG